MSRMYFINLDRLGLMKILQMLDKRCEVVRVQGADAQRQQAAERTASYEA